ncbi:hypothetical protein CAAN1_04S03994 [[Candida] anglica]|uniref:Uncharacterized protein n=1 Tax=[Candida] anglica TaxID=148631 RepID=A0ABP0E8U2_9ASCO
MDKGSFLSDNNYVSPLDHQHNSNFHPRHNSTPPLMGSKFFNSFKSSPELTPNNNINNNYNTSNWSNQSTQSTPLSLSVDGALMGGGFGLAFTNGNNGKNGIGANDLSDCLNMLSFQQSPGTIHGPNSGGVPPSLSPSTSSTTTSASTLQLNQWGQPRSQSHPRSPSQHPSMQNNSKFSRYPSIWNDSPKFNIPNEEESLDPHLFSPFISVDSSFSSEMELLAESEPNAPQTVHNNIYSSKVNNPSFIPNSMKVEGNNNNNNNTQDVPTISPITKLVPTFESTVDSKVDHPVNENSNSKSNSSTNSSSNISPSLNPSINSPVESKSRTNNTLTPPLAQNSPMKAIATTIMVKTDSDLILESTRNIINASKIPKRKMGSISTRRRESVKSRRDSDIIINLPHKIPSTNSDSSPIPKKVFNDFLLSQDNMKKAYQEDYCSTFYKRNQHGYMFVKEPANSLKVNTNGVGSKSWVQLKVNLPESYSVTRKVKVDVRELPYWKPATSTGSKTKRSKKRDSSSTFTNSNEYKCHSEMGSNTRKKPHNLSKRFGRRSDERERE